ncbi:DegT/DnrJ/EryC1/StrS family aminotransferase [Candidatus Methanodesulfokora washburnensis]|nr:DegT/DnrJ/EryC1/StrS family aminotransferase [Candidatus Methanodesulfokores washburnensis]
MTVKKVIPISKPFLGKEELNEIEKVLESGMLAQGEKVREFEQKFADYIGTKHAVAVSNGTAALHIALIAMGLRPRDQALTSAFTFFSSASTIVLCGAVPRFSDVDERTMNIDPEKMNLNKCKIVIPVHLHGHPADMDPIMEKARKEGALVLEDAAQAHGAEYRGRKVGSMGDAAIFSFYPTKNMTTGEGGMITTNDEEIAEKARILRDQGQKSKYIHWGIGFNYRMTEINAAIGLVQLRKLDSMNKRRETIARIYSEELNIRGIRIPYVAPWAKHAWHLYPLMTDARKRDEIVDRLNAVGVMARKPYPMPVQEQEAMKMLNDPERNYLAVLFDKVEFERTPVAEKLTKEVFYIPIHPSMSDEDVNYVVDSVKSVLKQIS